MTNLAVVKTEPSFLYTERELTKLCMSGNKIYGLLARGIPANIDTGSLDIGNLKGKYGESVIGSLLNILALEDEDLYVFHSVATHSNKPGETDHIIIYKNKLILIETKTYHNFKTFKINREGELRGRKIDQPQTLRKLNNNNLIDKVSLYQRLFPEYKVHAITAITRAGVETFSENGKYKVASLDNLLQNLDYHISQAEPVSVDLNEESVRFIASRCLNK